MRYTPEQNDAVARANREAAHAARNISQAYAVRDAATDLQAALESSGGKYDTRQLWHLFDLCNAMIALVDDGDCMAQRDNLMFELGCDEHGNPVDADGNPPARFNPSLVHPDNPSQAGGWA